MGYTLILQNNGSRTEYLITGLTEAQETFLAYIFNDFQMPEDAQEGEYTGVLFWDGRRDTEYILNEVILDTLCKTGEGDVYVRDLRPEIFLLKYGVTNQQQDEYRENNENYYYYQK